MDAWAMVDGYDAVSCYVDTDFVRRFSLTQANLQSSPAIQSLER
jgi:hypothetical protein